jgi:hypothetical protein
MHIRTLLTISSSLTSNFLLLRGERFGLVARLVVREPDEVVAGPGDLYPLGRLDGSNNISTYGTKREGIRKHSGATEHRERDIEVDYQCSRTQSNLNNQDSRHI